ncbi:MAG: D-alanyl-D-alanine carboxypeptidase/D-alanyl-D-alanine-endopeptidase [bacterium]|nr:D-alanyl-D-alanine carboxypeptidase/D-alanyl-D-alanine-endopeptidase [bacterium]
MKRTYRYSLLFLTLFLAGCAAGMQGGGKNSYVQKSVEKYLHNLYLKGSSWSIMAVDLDGGRIVLNIDSDRCLSPASGIKLLSSACALETLGPDYRIHTPIGYTGSLDTTGTLHGNLIVIGNGDPSISTRYSETITNRTGAPFTDTFSAWADTIAAHGIHKIEGDLVGYSGLFGGTPWGPNWEWNELKYWYAAEITPLASFDDCVEITITPADSVGKPASISLSPQVEGITVIGKIVTDSLSAQADLNFDRQLQGNNVTVWGRLPINSEPAKLRIAVYDADNYFLLALKKALADKGISISGILRASAEKPPQSADFQQLFTQESPQLGDLIRVVNRDSNNLHAEILIRVMGNELMSRGDPVARAGDDAFTIGRNQVRKWESKLVGSSPGFAMADGSGLSRRNLISASGLIKVLVYMNRSPQKMTFINSLATPGVGTLRGRFPLLPKDVQLFAKTGTMTRVKSLSGYLILEEKPRMALSIISNNYLCETSEIDQTMENIIQLLALYLKSPK